MATGLPTAPREVASSVFGPGDAPSVQAPTVATPFWSVTCVAPVTLPPPLPTLNVTCSPTAGPPPESRRMTDGATATAVPTTARCPSPRFLDIRPGSAQPIRLKQQVDPPTPK